MRELVAVGSGVVHLATSNHNVVCQQLDVEKNHYIFMLAKMAKPLLVFFSPVLGDFFSFCGSSCPHLLLMTI